MGNLIYQYLYQLEMKMIFNMNEQCFLEFCDALSIYYKELEAWKNGGVDLTKFDAHSTLYRSLILFLVDNLGFDNTMTILEECGKPTPNKELLMSVFNEFNTKKDASVKTSDTKESQSKPKKTKNSKINYYVDGKKVTKDEYESARKRFTTTWDEFFDQLFCY